MTIIENEMSIIEQWQAANPARSALYRWFADVFARELTSATLEQWQHKQTYASIHQVFVSLGLEPFSDRVKAALDDLQQFSTEDRAIELAADFAQIFLLSGDDSAPPYASYYLSSDKHLYGKPAAQMMRFLDSQQLSLHPDFREPNDHLSVYFIVMSLWINKSIEQQLEMVNTAQEQIDFLDSALLNWLPQFTAHCQKINVKTDIYPALAALAEQFILEDRAALATISN
jgi:TorA-specific chaperone